MAPKLILLTISLIAQAPAFALDPASYIGRVDPPTPAGCKDLGGGIVVKRENSVIAFKQIHCETETVFLLQEQANKSPPLKWRVLDVLTIRGPRHGFSVLSTGHGCEYTSDAAWIIAVGRWVPETVGGYASEIESGWIIPNDPNAKRFKPVAPSQLKCGYSEDRD